MCAFQKYGWKVTAVEELFICYGLGDWKASRLALRPGKKSTRDRKCKTGPRGVGKVFWLIYNPQLNYWQNCSFESCIMKAEFHQLDTDVPFCRKLYIRGLLTEARKKFGTLLIFVNDRLLCFLKTTWYMPTPIRLVMSKVEQMTGAVHLLFSTSYSG